MPPLRLTFDEAILEDEDSMHPFQPPELLQKCRWSYDSQTEAFSTAEVSNVVRHDQIASGSYRYLHDHVIGGIPQKWTPQVENFLMNGDTA